MPQNRIILKRIIISLLVGLAIGAAISEITFIFLRDSARPPETIILNIPPGTAQSVARGEQPPSLPDKMTFVVGDSLVVRNQDSVDHQLGPLWVPSGAEANLKLGTVESLAYECSFQTSSFIGIDVREPVTMGTRLYGIFYAGLPLGVLLALYSILIPTKKEKGTSPAS
jgi:hypothetical protein